MDGVCREESLTNYKTVMAKKMYHAAVMPTIGEIPSTFAEWLGILLCVCKLNFSVI